MKMRSFSEAAAVLGVCRPCMALSAAISGSAIAGLWASSRAEFAAGGYASAVALGFAGTLFSLHMGFLAGRLARRRRGSV